MSANDSPDESVAYTDQTLPTLVEGYNRLPTHAFAGFSIVQNDEVEPAAITASAGT